MAPDAAVPHVNFSICADGRVGSGRATVHASISKTGLLSMETVWSRWLLGAWAVLTVAWLLLAALMLVHTWPDPSLDDRQMLWGDAGEGPLRAGTAASGAAKEHFTRYLVFALLPPVFLLGLICIGLWIAGLPFPTLRPARRSKVSNSG